MSREMTGVDGDGSPKRPWSARVRRAAESWWAIGVIALLVSFNLYQRFRPAGQYKPPTFVSVGESLAPSYAFETSDGRPAVLRWSEDGRATLLYIFQPSCVWCTRNRDNFRTVLEHASDYRVIGLSLTSRGLKEYLANNGYNFPVYVTANRKSVAQLKLNGTPETLIVSPAGKVEKVWVGAYGGKSRSDIEMTFGVKLAGFEQDLVTQPGRTGELPAEK
jgi:hypothetical protein